MFSGLIDFIYLLCMLDFNLFIVFWGGGYFLDLICIQIGGILNKSVCKRQNEANNTLDWSFFVSSWVWQNHGNSK